MSMKALEWAMYDARRNGQRLCCASCSCSPTTLTRKRADFPSQKRIVALTGYSRRTIQNAACTIWRRPD